MLFPLIIVHMEFKEADKITSLQHSQARRRDNPQGTVGKKFIVQMGSHETGADDMIREGARVAE